MIGLTVVNLISLIVATVAGLLSIPVAVLFIEVIAARRPQEREPATTANPRSCVSVIIPAHNESIGLVPTIEDIKPQLKAGDRLIVVADNCSDDTAKVAATSGAEVIVRCNPDQIGKGYALASGIEYLKANPPAFVVFVDADCRVDADMIARLVEVCGKLQRPVQACFLMKAAENSPINHRLAEFAFLLRNLVRPLGLRNLSGPVQLMGSGMIFPWQVISSASLASGHLVEDLKLGLDLAAVGKAPSYFPFVRVTSDFPVTAKGADSQRQRWVQGHIGMILRTVPRYLFLAITRRNLDLLILTFDLLVPPLSLLALLIGATLVLTSLAAIFVSSLAPMLIATGNLLFFAFAVALAWRRFGRDGSHINYWEISAFVQKKLQLYGQLLLGKTAAKWIRTDRTKIEKP